MINWIFAAILAIAYVLETTVMQGLAVFGVVPDLVLVVLIACSILQASFSACSNGTFKVLVKKSSNAICLR